MKPRRLHFEALESRRVLSTWTGEAPTDLAARPADALVAFYLTVTDGAGKAESSYQTGETLLLNIFVEDLRADAEGVFAALLDVFFDSDLVVPTGTPEFGSQFPNMHQYSCGLDGVLDEIGAIGGLAVAGPGPLLVMQIPFVAAAPGSFVFAADPADYLPANEILVYGLGESIPNSQVKYGSVQIEISGSPLQETPVPCDSTIPRGPVLSDSELEEIADREREQRPPAPPAEPGPEARDDDTVSDSVLVDRLPEPEIVEHDSVFIPLSLPLARWSILADVTAGAEYFTAPTFGIGLVDLPLIGLDDPLVFGPATDETGPADLATVVEDVRFKVDLPIGTASSPSISTLAVSARSSDPALEEVLRDGWVLTLLMDEVTPAGDQAG